MEICMIRRILTEKIINKLFKKKAIIICGARQTGKTTLTEMIAEKLNLPTLFLNCDEPDVQSMLERPTSTELKRIFGKNKLVVIDEAQRINNFGITAKLIVDQIPDVQLIVSGSSSFDIKNKLNEPLTGRKFEFQLYPFSFDEMVNHSSIIEEKRLLEQRMIFGYYPDIVNNSGDEKLLLTELTTSYLYKDILAIGQLRKPDVLDKLVKALALQIGSEVSLNELSNTIGVDKNTVANYIDLLEKTYVIFSLQSFSKNIRNEIKKSRKIYFWDNGVRNAVINNFNNVDLRVDKGGLWENFVISERLKFLKYSGKRIDSYFWRSYQQQEIDYIEVENDTINGWEIKWNKNQKNKGIKTFKEYYPNSTIAYINNENFIDFLTEQ